MRVILTAVFICASGASVASAECYGDAAQAFGCGVSRSSEGTLARFGGENTDVIPDYGTSRQMTVDDLFTAEEQRQMYKGIVMGNRQTSWSRNAFTQAMEAAQRPVRPSRNMPSVIGPMF